MLRKVIHCAGRVSAMHDLDIRTIFECAHLKFKVRRTQRAQCHHAN